MMSWKYWPKVKKNGFSIISNYKIVENDKLILNKLHIDGLGLRVGSIFELKQMAREIGKMCRVEEVIIKGGARTAGHLLVKNL